MNATVIKCEFEDYLSARSIFGIFCATSIEGIFDIKLEN